MSKSEADIDVVELCVLLQCLGFKVTSLDSSDGNLTQEGGGGVRSVVLHCQTSGLHVVLETTAEPCSCPPSDQQSSGFWQVSGVSGGKQTDKETGSAIFGALPKSSRQHLASQLKEMLAYIKESQALDGNTSTELPRVNKSTSMIEMKTPDKMKLLQAPESPGRYRSLDTLTSKSESEALPTPGQLQKKVQELSTDEVKPEKETVQVMGARQGTYTIATPASFRRRNKTSSPINPNYPPPNTLLENLLSAERAAEDLRSKLSAIVKDVMEEGKNDSSLTSLALDVSKISVMKATEISKTQFTSSPNLSGPSREEQTKSRLKRFESASTSNLAKPKEGTLSKLKRLSPNFFTKKGTPGKDEKGTKASPAAKPRIVTPIRVTPKSEPSPIMNISRKRYSHIKSTIPRPTPKKEI